MYEVTVHRVFCAAHAIRIYDGSVEPLHGHNWTVAVTVGSGKLDEIEVVMDFHALEKVVDDLLETAHNRSLNDLKPFAGGKVNPTAERVAWWIGEAVRVELPAGVNLLGVRVGEAPGCEAVYRPE